MVSNNLYRIHETQIDIIKIIFLFAFEFCFPDLPFLSKMAILKTYRDKLRCINCVNLQNRNYNFS